MRLPKTTTMLATMLLALAATLPGQSPLVGGALPTTDLGPLSGGQARTLQDCTGRLLLLEFFAYW